MRFILWTLPLNLLRFTFYASVFLTPILGIWLASSLVAYINGPPLLAVASGILLFPIIPIVWEMLQRRKRGRLATLTWGDRITLRTLALNLVFILLLLLVRPQTAFLALSTRGDWMLDNQSGQTVELTRQSLFQLANGLEWLYNTFHENPFEQYANDTGSSRVLDLRRPRPDPSQAATEWPWTGVGLHPAVANMPASVETSIASVAQYIVQQESDPVQRVKALHDYVADRIAYDAPAYFSGQFPPQDAESVFRRRTAVCAGYSKLLEALGNAAGEEILYIVGDSRSQTSDLSGQGHAWNAAKINNQWYLIDATWDSGYVDRATGFTKEYKTGYLFPPPHVMAVSHLPDDPAWQLMSQPLSLGEFLRQPMMRPTFFAEGLTLLSPVRSQTDTALNAVIEVQNPNQRWLWISYNEKGHSQSEHCTNRPTQNNQITCTLPRRGTYEIKIFTGAEESGTYGYVGQVEFNRY